MARADVLGAFVVLAAGIALVAAYGWTTVHVPGLADEFVYLAGARHFAASGSLNARFYDADAILAIGYPHQDVHTPGYVLILGAVFRALGAGYWTAVGLNIFAYLVSAVFVGLLARELGRPPSQSWAAALGFLLLPVSLAYVFWVMPELLLGFLFLSGLLLAARCGESARATAAVGLLLGTAALVRESALLATPLFLPLVSGRRARTAFLGALLGFMLLVYAPLGRNRAPGGANFWRPAAGPAFDHQPVLALQQGRVRAAVSALRRHASANWEMLVAPGTPGAERGILASYLGVALLAGLSGGAGRARRLLVAALSVLLLMSALLFGLYVVAAWSGLRYVLFLMPALLAFAAGKGWGRVAFGALLLAQLPLGVATQRIFDEYKLARHLRQLRDAAYVSRYVRAEPRGPVLFRAGWRFGLDRPDVEVISSLPSGGRPRLRALEVAVPLELVVVPPGAALAEELTTRPGYFLLNAEDKAPLYLVFQRRR